MAGAGLITIAVLAVALVFQLVGFVLRALGLLTGQRQLAPYELNRRRAAGAAFVGALCAYVVQIGGWPLNQSPAWVPVALLALAGLSLLLVLGGLAGARGGPRDPFGLVISLAVAAGGYALLRGHCYVPRGTFAAEEINRLLPGVGTFAAREINRFLPGIYIAAVVAGLVRAAICVQPFGGERQPTPYESARQRATGAAFVLVVCLYVANAGASLLGGLPGWVPAVVLAAALLSLLLLASGLYATRNGPRDIHGVGVSLAAACVGAALLWWQWQVPPPGRGAELAASGQQLFNLLLPSLFGAVLIAALVRALICAQLLGGARRVIARAIRRRAMRMRPVSGSGFWAEMRDSFQRGLDGRPWRD